MNLFEMHNAVCFFSENMKEVKIFINKKREKKWTIFQMNSAQKPDSLIEIPKRGELRSIKLFK